MASTKPGGFQLEITNNDSTLVICGLRVAVGAVDTQKVPAYLEVRYMLCLYIIVLQWHHRVGKVKRLPGDAPLR